jgi:DNA-binding CsgD family transcriptional regulator
MSDRTPVVPSVALCDSQGVLVWVNNPNPVYQVGVPIWDYAATENRELIKDHVSRAAFFRQLQEFEVTTHIGERYHIWLWPVSGLTNVAVCVVGLRVPDEIGLLTARERECLQMLAQGRGTAEIAAKFDISLSTVQTYIRRSREKLNLSSQEALIAYASRYCYTPRPELASDSSEAGNKE